MNLDASVDDFESALKPLWLRAQSGDEVAYRQCLGMLATRLRGYLKRRLSGPLSCPEASAAFVAVWYSLGSR